MPGPDGEDVCVALRNAHETEFAGRRRFDRSSRRERRRAPIEAGRTVWPAWQGGRRPAPGFGRPAPPLLDLLVAGSSFGSPRVKSGWQKGSALREAVSWLGSPYTVTSAARGPGIMMTLERNTSSYC
jgi:hypothetical protein